MMKWYLLWYLSEVADKTQDGALNQRIFDVVEVHLVSIEVRVVGVNGLHSSWAMLLVAKNQVYPAMEVCTDIVTFQCLKPKKINSLECIYCRCVTTPCSLLETNSPQYSESTSSHFQFFQYNLSQHVLTKWDQRGVGWILTGKGRTEWGMLDIADTSYSIFRENTGRFY